MKQLLGVIVKDLLRYLFSLMRSDNRYLALCNRTEYLDPAPDKSGYRCDWEWTSDLHAVKIVPILGRWLMKRALSDHPIRRLLQPELSAEQPQISFIIGHRGADRMPHLLATLESIAAQKNVSLECLVVEQDVHPLLKEHLPSWVRYFSTVPPTAEMPYCRSWAFNVGVKHARGKVFVLHDNDMLVPVDYASQILSKIEQGYEVVNLKRFIFYLNEFHTRALLKGGDEFMSDAPETVVQNLEGGGSVAITYDAFERIGGMDESFIGWGGEDNEFWERAQTCKVWPYGYLSLVHLWHRSQPGKYQADNPTLQGYQMLSKIPVAERIVQLRSRAQGQSAGPQAF